MDPSIADADRVLGEADERSFARWFPIACEPAEIEPVARERLADHLRTSTISERFRNARAKWFESGAESGRRGLRILAELYLERASAEADVEIARLRSRSESSLEGAEVDWALAGRRAEREERFEQWVEIENRERELLAERSQMRSDAARAATASSLCEFLGAGHAVDPAGIVNTFERGAIEPLDEVVEIAVTRMSDPLGLDIGRGRFPWIERLPPARIAGVVRRIGSAFGEDPDSDGPKLSGRSGDGLRARTGLTRCGEALLLPGRLPGPAGLMDLLGGFGIAARAGRIASLRGTWEVRCCDPAYTYAAHTLWRRLALCHVFRGDSGLELEEPGCRQLAFQDAVAMRLAWTYLHTVNGGIAPDGADFDRAIRRATGFDATPAQRRVAWDGDPRGSSELRGTVLGLLLEERLRLRFGRRWFGHREAQRQIVEMWEAEPDLTAEEMARSLDLGTIEPTPIVDSSRGMIAS